MYAWSFEHVIARLLVDDVGIFGQFVHVLASPSLISEPDLAFQFGWSENEFWDVVLWMTSKAMHGDIEDVVGVDTHD